MACDDFDFDALLITLGKEFVARGMDGQAEHLRALIRRRRQRPSELWWDEAVAVQWLARLQIRPFDHVLRVQARGVGCPTCSKSGEFSPGNFVPASWKGGHMVACHVAGCGQRWLVLE